MSAATLALEAARYIREEADFNRSWVDGRRGGSYPEGYKARRLEIADQREAWASAIEAVVADNAAQSHGRPQSPAMRIAIVQDTEGRWFVRRIASSRHDLSDDEMVYTCDAHLAGPYDDVVDAAHWVTDNRDT